MAEGYVKQRYAKERNASVHIRGNGVSIILKAAVDLMLHVIPVGSFKDEPKFEPMRAKIEPAYEVVAEVLTELLGRTVTSKQLVHLAVTMHPTIGALEVHVTYIPPDRARAPYNLKVFGSDGKTIFTRTLQRPIKDSKKDQLEQAWEFQQSL